jgi:sugar phosphate isomerase/epimerase
MAEHLAAPTPVSSSTSSTSGGIPKSCPKSKRAGSRIAGFHVSDWPVPLPGILMGRAMMGDGVIELRKLREAVDATGYTGPIEVEIFNEEIWKNADETLPTLIQSRFVEHC